MDAATAPIVPEKYERVKLHPSQSLQHLLIRDVLH